MAEAVPAPSPVSDPSTLLSASRTALSFERTLLSSDRTLMSSVRTALSLISFGFTIAQLFAKLRQSGMTKAVGDAMPRNFGLALIVLGIAVLVMGVLGHRKFERELNARGDALYREGLLPSDIHYQITPTFFAAITLIGIGLLAGLSLFVRALGAGS